MHDATATWNSVDHTVQPESRATATHTALHLPFRALDERTREIVGAAAEIAP